MLSCAMTFIELQEKFPTEHSIIAHFRTIRYRNGLICPECGTEHVRDINAAINLKENAIKNVGQGVSEFRSVEGVEDLASLALAIVGASDEAENLTGNGQNVLTL